MSPVLSLTMVTFATALKIRRISSTDMSMPLVAGLLYSMMGRSMLAPMAW
ncbi:hypothetical protein ALO79_200015 [Pseudomonas syringae pv. castaneae]|uniref:Uncharacterized protein n=1 Tax=Pseudomonas syringae pv. castaneae TaxID=264450 RepID=A0A0P9N0P8_PSESX|nr:hypothetical protein ALO79_200015 [Pseudomonas syringae pv. castaneae]